MLQLFAYGFVYLKLRRPRFSFFLLLFRDGREKAL